MNISPHIEAAAASTRLEADARTQRGNAHVNAVVQPILNMMQVIARGAVPQGMSDDQLDLEHRAQIALDEAIAAMSAAVAKVNWQSSVVKIDSVAWANFIHDELPTTEHWDEKIAEARR